ncbi:MAG: tetratricopeptide repeat protein [Pedosphaera sp.]|nr:tetratricopeptide repeat protein [Pedosphaera sp.]
MCDLADTYRRAGKLDQALPLHEEALKLTKTKLGPYDEETLRMMGNLVITYKQAGKLDQALPLAEETLKLMKAKLGPDHPETLLSMLNLALNYKQTGKLDQALPLFRAAAEKDGVEALNHFAWLLATCSDSALRDGRSAVGYAEKAVAKTQRKDPGILETLAAAYAEAGEFVKAANVQREAISLIQDEKAKNDLTPRLKLYESKTPFRE